MKHYLLLAILLYSSTTLFAQKDTLWFNKNWQKVNTKNEATFYLSKLIGKSSITTDYYLPENKEIGKLIEIKNTTQNTSRQDGNNIIFVGDNIYKNEIYKRGKIRKIIYYDNNGIMRKRETYDQNNYITLTENLDKKGLIISTLTYSLETGLPYMGQLINLTGTGEIITTYKLGKIVNKKIISNNDSLLKNQKGNIVQHTQYNK